MNELSICTSQAMIASASCANTAAATSAALDLLLYDGPALLMQNKGAGAGTLDGKLQHSHDGATGWEDTGIAFTQAGTDANLQTRTFETKSLRRYVRYVGTIATGPHLLSVTLTARTKYI